VFAHSGFGFVGCLVAGNIVLILSASAATQAAIKAHGQLFLSAISPLPSFQASPHRV